FRFQRPVLPEPAAGFLAAVVDPEVAGISSLPPLDVARRIPLPDFAGPPLPHQYYGALGAHDLFLLLWSIKIAGEKLQPPAEFPRPRRSESLRRAGLRRRATRALMAVGAVRACIAGEVSFANTRCTMSAIASW